MRTTTRRLLSALTAALLTTGVSLAATAPAQAATSLAVCAGSEHSEFDPAVTDTPTEIFSSTQASYTCTLPLLESVTRSASGTAVLSCADLLSPFPGTDVLHWGNGGTSNYSFTITVTTVNGITVVTKTGAITSGRYAGATVVETVNLGSLDLGACSGAGISSADYLNTLVVVDV